MSKYTEDFAAMGKVELRAACKLAGITYGKLDNAGMRAALEAKAATHDAPVKSTADALLGKSLLDKAIDAGIGAPTAIEKGAASELAVRKPPKRAPLKKEATVRKVRAAANGVTKPSSGTICGQIWDALDAKRTEMKGETPTFEHLRELAKAYDWQKNTAMTQYQRWKQFNGLMPRSLGGANDAGTI